MAQCVNGFCLMNIMQFPNQNLSDHIAVDTAVAVLRRGGLVAFPTETVYGLGADAENPGALERLYVVKGRPQNHPVIVHLAASARVEDWAAAVPDAAYRLAESFWPGPLTLILPRASRVPDAVTGGQDTVGLRVPDHPIAQALLRGFGGGVAAPSANRFGCLSPTRAEHVRADLGGDVDIILDGGACPVGVESTIVAFRDGRPIVLRPGRITSEQLEAALKGEAVLIGSPGGADGVSKTKSKGTDLNTVSRAPGMLARHYAPRTPLELLLPEALLQSLSDLSGHAPVRVGVLALRTPPSDVAANVHWVRADSNPIDYARALYAHLRMLDQAGLDVIFVEAVPESGPWAAVADRLRRAAAR